MMKNPKDKRPKTVKAQSGAGKSDGPPKVSAPWGRSASEYRPGLFINQYFLNHEEGCAADIYRALTEKIEGLNGEREYIEETPLRRPNYSSFNRYMHWFLILGLIERTERREPAIYSFLQKKVFYRLTQTGKTEVVAWGDPIGAAHPEFR